MTCSEDAARVPSEGVEMLMTAAEAFPEMERAFLNSRTEVWASLRVFDLQTRLRSEVGQRIGSTWEDLIIYVLRRGVTLNIIVSDFDAVMANPLHVGTWQTMRHLRAAALRAGPDAKLNLTAAAHPARVGGMWCALFWPAVRSRLNGVLEDLNQLEPAEQDQRLAEMPGLDGYVRRDRNGRLCARLLPVRPLLPATHHQKIAVFDRQRLYIGGLDLDERRFDDTGHHRRRDETWQDVQLMLDDPEIVAEGQAHLESFLDICAGTKEPPKRKHLLTTLSRPRDWPNHVPGPRQVDATLKETHLRRIREAKHLIYLESQFFRDTELADALAEAAREKPDLGLVMVLPAAPEDVAFDGNTGSDARYGEYLQAQCIAKVQDAFGARAVIMSPVQPVAMASDGRDTLAGSPIIYVHTKFSVFDDCRAILSSANLNGRSMTWDTEVGVELRQADTVAAMREQVCGHWLQMAPPSRFLDPERAVEAWRAQADANQAASPEERTGFLVPYDPAPAAEFGRRLPFVSQAMV
ncbi:phospholipase D-like domain-containing protein [Tritonibacter sp. SIMBA_163]|uniref:phospholipase D-like domain-containing protein n=1 Tax=Tritonibacter sp. SIMBA_163 TaxID=3080868 RepID=UPI00398082D3